jgi:tetratricopeptide (TPR) repeat protein
MQRLSDVAAVGRSALGKVLLVVGLVAIIGLTAIVIGGFGVAASRLRAGRDALERRDFLAAKELLEASAKVWNCGEAHRLAARAARYLEAYDEAEEHLKAAQNLDGKSAAIDLERTLMLAQRGAVDDSVDQYLQGCIAQRHPDSPVILEALAEGYFKLFRIPQSALCLQLWISQQPKSAEPLIRRGQLFSRLHHFEKAETDYRQALLLEPDSLLAGLHLAGLLDARTRSGEALPYYESLRRRFPDEPRILMGLGHCYLQLGRPDDARQVLDHLMELYPDEGLALAERGQLALQAGQVVDAEKFFRQAIERDPFDQEAIYALSLCLRREGRQEEAEKYLTRSERVKTWFNRLTDATTRMFDVPHDAEPRYQAGVVFVEMGMEEEALRWFLAGLKEDPKHKPTNNALADYYERIGQTAVAAQYRQAAHDVSAPGFRVQSDEMGLGIRKQ